MKLIITDRHLINPEQISHVAYSTSGASICFVNGVWVELNEKETNQLLRQARELAERG